jgi:diguanylate cyclase (GGDEF)-like protein
VLTFVGTLRDITQRRRRQSELLGARRELEEANRELALMARTDELTGLANRREFDERLALELRRAARTSMPVAICMCDVDFFKRFNDAAGHLAGDECLRLVGRIVRGRFRRSAEVPARYGGEEFAVLVPGVSSAASAIAVGERLRRRILEERIEHPDSPLGAFVTTSAGVAWGYPSAGIEPESALAEADAALYAAKDAGRDRVELSIAWPSPGAPAEPEGPRRRHPAGSQTIARK